jgi:DNA-directed RNA polymerase specialized sigma24 family protein
MLMKTQMVDFHAVEPHQREIDRRLHNWARWCNGTSVGLTSPMFRMAPPPPRVRGDLAYASAGAVDRMDAQRIAKAVAALPAQHRASINWCYVKPVSPRRACQAIGVSMEELDRLVRDGRQMLINRNV